MALRTNNKKVKETIKNYIMDSFHASDFESWHDTDITNYNQICSIILSQFYIEKVQGNKQRLNSMYDYFVDWCQGLPSILDTCYYYNVSAADLLGGWLEQTEETKSKYTERQAEAIITSLIYRELTSNGDYLPKVKRSVFNSLQYAEKSINGKYNICLGCKEIGQEPGAVCYLENIHFIIVNG